jgi:hypothetical protein
MIVTIERVSTFNLRNLLGHDCSQKTLDAHVDCLTRSTAIWLGKADGVEACAIGVIPATIFSRKAYLWMISTKICEQHPLRFIRWSRKVIDEVLALYPDVIGLCSCNNLSGRQWLEWLGAKFDPTPVNDGHYGFKIEGRDDLVGYRING